MFTKLNDERIATFDVTLDFNAYAPRAPVTSYGVLCRSRF